jgi:hypothetical protein
MMLYAASSYRGGKDWNAIDRSPFFAALMAVLVGAKTQ